MIRQLAASLVLGMMAPVVVISFASIIYAGPLSPSLDRGIGLSLIGTALMAGLATALMSYRGTVMHAQDATAILLGTGTASIAAAGAGLGQDALFATTAALIAVATALAGLACVVLGHLRLGFIARYLPYPVLGGFLAATGYLLVVGGTGVVLGTSVSLWSLGQLVAPGAPGIWLPWVLAAAATVVVSRRSSHGLALPACIIASAAAFYAWLALSGTPLSVALDRGLLLGPFPASGFVSAIHPSVFREVDWWLVAEQAPVLIAIVTLSVLGALLNMTGINHLVGNDGDLNADLRATGYANLLSAGSCGMVGYPALGETVLGARMGPAGALAGITVAVTAVLAAVFGASVLGMVPRGLFGMLLVYIGLDLLWTWLQTERRRLLPRDFAIVLVILVVAAAVGFLEALAVGILVSMALFTISYSRLDFIRLQTTLANRRSIVERAEPARLHLMRAGGDVIVLELTGILFFGTATRLRSRIRSALDGAQTPPAALVLDFRRVRDVDASAAVSLAGTFDELRRLGLDVRACAVPPEALDRLRLLGPLGAGLHATLDEALQDLEEKLLQSADPPVSDRGSFLGRLGLAHPGLDAEAIFPVCAFEPGALMVEEDSPSSEIFVLLDGEASAVVGRGERANVVARFLPGALIGEIAFYGEVRRSASVRAEGPVRALRIDAHLLGPESPLPAPVVSTIHRLAAATLSQRLARTTRLLRDAEE